MPASESRPRLLIVTHDVVDAKVAGLGMRYLEFSRALAPYLEVTLASPYESSLAETSFQLVHYAESKPESLRRLVEANDVALISGYMLQKFPFLNTTATRLIVDLITPFILENLHYFPDQPVESREVLIDHAVEVTNQLARAGDFFVCGSERQRDFWLGLLAANHRINPRNSAADPNFRRLIDVVGFGIPDRPPAHGQPVLQGVHPSFGSETKIIWWGGGAWDWLDPVTLVEAWPRVITRHPEARLVFLTTQPNPLVPRPKKAETIERLAVEIGERDKSIFFLEWLSYEARESLLCEAHVGAVLHPLHLETHFSVRTRVLDYVWAGLPVLITEGDVMSEWVREKRLGLVVPPQDPEAVAAALSELLDRPKADWAPAFAAVSEAVRWPKVVRPILSYCQEGSCAPDRVNRQAAVAGQPFASAPAAPSWLAQVVAVWRLQGLREVLVRANRVLRQKLFDRSPSG